MVVMGSVELGTRGQSSSSITEESCFSSAKGAGQDKALCHTSSMQARSVWLAVKSAFPSNTHEFLALSPKLQKQLF